MQQQRHVPRAHGERIVICNYNALLQSVTGLLRMSGYCVFEAHDGLAAEELCIELPKIQLLILNTFGTGINIGELIRRVRSHDSTMAVLHIGNLIPDGLPGDVPSVREDFSAASLLEEVGALLARL